ncbi:TPR repeat [Novymonas esmeraldas]|uniref:TPR repeat n=1 Tax=Novymonas esmeraldas TaxID=1808958 RepID=A0AAW0F4R6_9TRYP
MFMDVSATAEEDNLISLCPEDDGDIPDMPFFAASNLEDRPMAPAAEDYPLGCEVELRDVEFAKIAQESSHWEPIMEAVFAVPRRRVRVDRHTGDYTFVLCNDIDGFERVGCTLYRACLSEPKVKATRYYSSIRSGLSGLELEDNADDILSKPVQPGAAAATTKAVEADSTAVEANVAASAPVGNNGALTALKPARSAAAVVSSVDDARRRSFMAYMKKGTAEISKRNCEAALRYYNRALEEMPEEEARVRSSRSVAYLLVGEKERALEDANRVVHLVPRESVGYIRTGNVLRSMKKFVDAQKMYATALKYDSSSMVVRNLLEGNSVAMLYEGRTKRYNKMRIAYDDTMKRAMAVAAQNIDANEIVMKEASSCVFPLSSGMYRVVSGRRRCPLCCHCGRPFVDEAQVTEQIPGLTKQLLNSLHVVVHPVPCDSNCNALYCSESCKSKAWVEHHWVECTQRGRWRDAVPVVHRLLDQYVSSCSAGRPQEEDPADVSPAPQCVAEDTRPIVTAACVRIAVRMMSRMVSSVLPAQEAVLQYRWLPTAEVVRAQRREVRDLLMTCYSTLSRSFSSEDSDQLTFDVFQEYYEKAKSNSIMICCSMWPKVVERVSSHLDFVTAEDSPAGLHDNEAPFHSCLQQIMSAPRQGVPGTYHICISLFELASLMTPNNCTRSETTRPNVMVRTFAESAANLRLRTLRHVSKKEVLTMAWPAYDAA